MKKIQRSVTAVALIAGLACTTAYAGEVQFTVTDTAGSTVNVATFDVAANPTPGVEIGTTGFTINSVPISIESGTSHTQVTEQVQFYDTSSSTSYVADGEFFNDTVSGNVFTGSNSDPTFVPGTYSGGTGVSVVIADVVPTPIPPTLPLMIAGLIGLGFFMRQQRANI